MLAEQIKKIIKTFIGIHYYFKNIWIKLCCRYKLGRGGVFFQGRVIFEKNISFYLRKPSLIHVKDRTRFCRNCKIVLNGGKLLVGEGCTIGEQNIFNVFDEIYIGENVLTADRVSFITNIHNYDDISKPISCQQSISKPIYIGDGTWIGINATILAGCSIGKNCVVGANAVVSGVFPDYCVIAGVPARIVKKFDAEKMDWCKMK